MRTVIMIAVVVGHLFGGIGLSVAGAQEQTSPDRRRVEDHLKRLRSEDPAERTAGAKGLGELAGAASTAVPALISALEDDARSVRAESARALAEFGEAAEPAVPALVTQARQSEIRDLLLYVGPLAHLGGSLPSARAALLEFLVDDDPKVRWFTAWAINRADLDSADIVAGLANATFDQDLVVAIYARQALTDLGERASVAIPVIVARAAPDAESDPFLVTGNLQELVPEVPGALAALASLLRHPDSEMRMWAVSRIESCGPDGAGAVPDLVRALSANDSELEPGCLEALAAIGPGANKSLPTITRCLSGDWPREAAWAVASICEGAKKGKEDRTAIRALRQSLREADASYRTPMLYALWVLTGEANGVVPALTCGIKEGNHSDRCLDALASMGPAAREAIPFLEDLRKSKHLTDREAATLALCRIEPRKEIPAQAALLFAEDSTVREAAIQLLLALGPSAQAAVPLIQKRLVQTGPAVRGDGAGLTQGEIEALISERLDLIEVLVNIGPGAEPSIATLQEVQGHDREPAETRDAAAAAIKALRKN